MRTIAIIFLGFGIFFFILDDVIAFWHFMMSGEFVERMYSFITGKERNKKPKLKKYIKKELLNEDDVFIMRAYNEMKEELESMGDGKNAKTYGVLFVLAGLLGVALALFIGNFFLIPVLGIGFALIPTWVVKLREYNYRKKLNNELSVALAAITTAYIRSNNLIKAIEENIDSMKKPVHGVFQDFLNRYYYIDKNMKNNIRILSNQFNSKIFKLWCQELIVCMDDGNYKHSLTVVVSQFALDKETQDNLSVKLNSPIRETIMIIAITLLLYPLLSIFGNGTPELMSNTLIGQTLTTLLWLSNIYGIDKAIRLSAPVE